MTHCVRLHIRNVTIIPPDESLKTITLHIDNSKKLKSKDSTTPGEFSFLEDMEFFDVTDLEFKVYASKKLLGVGTLRTTKYALLKELMDLNIRVLDFNTSEKVGSIGVLLQFIRIRPELKEIAGEI